MVSKAENKKSAERLFNLNLLPPSGTGS